MVFHHVASQRERNCTLSRTHQRPPFPFQHRMSSHSMPRFITHPLWKYAADMCLPPAPGRPTTDHVRKIRWTYRPHPIRRLFRFYHSPAKCRNCFPLPVAVHHDFEHSRRPWLTEESNIWTATYLCQEILIYLFNYYVTNF